MTDSTDNTDDTTENTGGVLSGGEGGVGNEGNEGGDGNEGGEDYSFMPQTFVKDGKPDYEGLAQSYNNLRTKMSDGAPPESADAYNIETVIPIDESMQQEFLKEAFENGVSQKQMDFMIEKWEQQIDFLMPNVEKVGDELQSEWGDQLENHIDAAKRAFTTYGNGLDVKMFEANKDIMAFMARVGAELDEDSPGDASGNDGGYTPSLNATEVDSMMNSPDYWENSSKQAAVANFFKKGGKLG